ncbi:methionine ABC transporter ATP-binding protein [Egicoccus halophilus]|uniref:Methionine import ATP-binding protein MetN n=1 Tax=Egicoccus halophilus TaxID=1670830 RepID=A0A8J3A928_9ACTN|nr:ATP-binding cassette domain-containing protein [Egicoccus halophilus]GGI05088.1 methionine import ATP-binding protein MetN [Egicoccus halophilus]
MIRLSGVSKVFPGRSGDVVALADVDIEVGRGEICGVVGQSGAGKSTLLRCVNLLERPSSGSVEIDGVELTTLDAAALRDARRGIGTVFQQFALLSSRSAADNVALPLEVAGVPRARRRERVRELLELVGLEDRADAHPAQLSGGQQQRVGIARALATEPRVLLCDEATSALDPETTDQILDLLRDLNRRLDLTVLLITHEMHVVERICDRGVLLKEGRVVESGRVADLLAQPRSVLAAGLGPKLPAPDPDVAARIEGTLLDVRFLGDLVGEPVIADLVRRFDLDVSVVGGGVDVIAGTRIGRLHLQLPAGDHAGAIAHLRRRGAEVEVIA